ncbi:MAG: hypothetical protein ABI783_07510, partial [Actinomycetota bacterium]
ARDEFRRAKATEDYDVAHIYAGQTVGLLDAVRPAATIVTDIETQAQQLLREVGGVTEVVQPGEPWADARNAYMATRRSLERLWEDQGEGKPPAKSAAAAVPDEPTGHVSVVDLLAGYGRGPVWGEATDDLNLTLLAWPAGEGPSEHVNDERDVALVVLEGTGSVRLDGSDEDVRAGHVVVIPQGVSRSLTAGPHGIRYLSVHRRRGGLQIQPLHARGLG